MDFQRVGSTFFLGIAGSFVRGKFACEYTSEGAEKMKNWIMNFIADESGAESIEFGVGALTIAGGTAATYTQLKENLQDKGDDLITKISVSGN